VEGKVDASISESVSVFTMRCRRRKRTYLLAKHQSEK